MALERFAVVVATVFCMTSGSAGVYAGDLAPDPASSDSAAALHHLGVCGPIYDAILLLGPKDSEGRLDVGPIGYEKTAFESSTVLMPAPEFSGLSFAGHQPTQLTLFTFKGMLQAALFSWYGTTDENSAILEDALQMLTSSKGEPEPRDDGRHEWRETDLRTVVGLAELEDSVEVFVACLSTEDEYLELGNATEADENRPTEAADAKTNTPAPILWLNRSLVATLLEYGQPAQDPSISDDGLVGLHYAEVKGLGDVPADFWWWFNDGNAVYAAGEFPPPRGASHARSSFQAFNEAMRGMYGSPVEEGPGEEPGGRYVVYTNGSQRLILTFLDPEGDPYFRIEAYETTQLDTLGPELRLNRDRPKQFTPPPSDSGLSRDSFGLEVGAG